MIFIWCGQEILQREREGDFEEVLTPGIFYGCLT